VLILFLSSCVLQYMDFILSPLWSNKNCVFCKVILHTKCKKQIYVTLPM